MQNYQLSKNLKETHPMMKTDIDIIMEKIRMGYMIEDRGTEIEWPGTVQIRNDEITMCHFLEYEHWKIEDSRDGLLPDVFKSVEKPINKTDYSAKKKDRKADGQ